MNGREFITNLRAADKSAEESKRPGVVFGDPMPTKKYSAADLLAQGVCGMYAPLGETAAGYEKTGEPSKAVVAPGSMTLRQGFPSLAAKSLIAYCSDPTQPVDIRIAARELNNWLTEQK